MADALSTWFAQQTNGVYNESDHLIGYYIDWPTLASGHVMLYQGETLGDPWNWRIKADLFDLTFAQMVNAGQYLIQKGFAPAWMTAQEIAAMRGGSGSAGVPDALQAPIGVALGPNTGAPPGAKFPAIDWQKLALYGAGGLVGLMVLNKVLNKALQ